MWVQRIGWIVLCWMVAMAVPAGVRAGGEAAEEPDRAPGIYLGDGTEAELLCPLSGVEVTDLPAMVEEDQLRRLPGSELRFTVVLSAELGDLGAGPSSLRLLRITPARPKAEMRVVATEPELFPDEETAFAIVRPQPLAPGRYHFALEQPGWTKGWGTSDVALSFFGCAFMVEEAQDDDPGR
jgi:hypothetical protein